MDIAALSMDLSTLKVQQSAGIAIMKKTMDASMASAGDLLKMMEQSVAPQVGAKLDLTA